MVQALSHYSSGCSTRRHRDSSDAHVGAARRSVLLLPLFACSTSRVGQFSKKNRFLVRILDQFQTDK